MGKFREGDRVKVMDLRTGVQHPGVVIHQTKAGYVTVRYDSGQTVIVAWGFVSAE